MRTWVRAVQNVRDFLQTQLDSEVTFSFLLNEHGDPRIFFDVFAKNSLIKNLFQEEKKFDSNRIFFWKIVLYRMYFGPGQDFKLTMELSEKVQYCHNQAIKNGIYEAIMIMSINEALLSR